MKRRIRKGLRGNRATYFHEKTSENPVFTRNIRILGKKRRMLGQQGYLFLYENICEPSVYKGSATIKGEKWSQ